jgi:hypothetical protein
MTRFEAHRCGCHRHFGLLRASPCHAASALNVMGVDVYVADGNCISRCLLQGFADGSLDGLYVPLPPALCKFDQASCVLLP